MQTFPRNLAAIDLFYTYYIKYLDFLYFNVLVAIESHASLFLDNKAVFVKASYSYRIELI